MVADPRWLGPHLLVYRGGKANTLAGSGTQTATVGTEHTLLDVAAPGVYTLHVDLNAMAAGDLTILRIYEIVLTGGTRRVVWEGSYVDAQAADGKISVAEPVENDLTDSGALRFTLQQTLGTGRAYPWKVISNS